jgi:hypothetical protein
LNSLTGSFMKTEGKFGKNGQKSQIFGIFLYF